jgi:ABC-type branched-subunit amino acid transport system substrate-binding protein
MRLGWRTAMASAFLLVACASGSAKQAGDISIGVVGPFTGSAAQLGTLLSAPCYAAADSINGEGGVLGHKVDCAAIDDTGDPGAAAPSLARAISKTTNFDMAIGLESNTAMTTVPIVNTARIPFFTTNGLAAFTKNAFAYYYRLTPGDDATAAALGIWAMQRGFRNVAVVAGGGDLSAVRAVMPKVGGSVVISLTIRPDAPSYSAEVAQVIAAKPDALIWSADPKTTATFLSNYKQLNMGRLPAMVTAASSLTTDFFNAVKGAAGVNYATQDVYLVGPDLNQSSQAFDDYRSALLGNAKTHDRAPDLSTNWTLAGAYDGINIMALAMIMAGATAGPTYNSYILKVVQRKQGAVVVGNFADGVAALRSGKQIQYVGVLGAPSFDASHNSAGEFDGYVFAPDASASPVGKFSGAQVLQMLA